MDNGELPVYLLTDQKIGGVLNYPVIKINFLSPSFSFNKTDYLIFTSKNGVRAIDRLNNEWKKYPSFAIGKATAKEIQNRGGRVEYIAKKAYGEDLAKEINQKYKNKNFLFFRAKKLVSDIKSLFINNNLTEVVIYETVCGNPKKSIKKPSIVIFTSPSTVKCFLKIETSKNIIPIAIGKKTHNTLLENGMKNILMPDTPSIQECIKIAAGITV